MKRMDMNEKIGIWTCSLIHQNAYTIYTPVISMVTKFFVSKKCRKNKGKTLSFLGERFDTSLTRECEKS